MDNNDSTAEKVKRVADAVSEFIETNEEAIEWVSEAASAGGKRLTIEGPEPLTDLHKGDDEIVISVESNSETGSQASVTEQDGEVVIEMGDHKYVADVPADSDVEGLSYEYNNGVLTLTIPRTEDSGTVEVESEREDGDMGSAGDGGGGESDGAS